MDSSSKTPQPDPGNLARLVLHLRSLRTEIERVKSGLPSAEETPFLHRQLSEQMEGLEQAFARLAQDAAQASTKNRNTKGRLGKVFSRPKTTSQPSPGFEGNSWTIPVAELIGFLSTARKTGILWVDCSDEAFVIEIKHGDLIRAMSNRTPEGLRLGELLVGQGSLDEGTVVDVVAAAKTDGLSLGGYLISSGRVSECDIKLALSKQVQGLFHRLLRIEGAVYRFQEGVDLEDAKELDLNVTQLLLESARQMDEAQLSSIIDIEPDLNQMQHDLAKVLSMGEEERETVEVKADSEEEHEEAA